MPVHPTWKKENMSIEKEGSLSLFPFSLARNKENGNIESGILIGCAPCTMILDYTLLAARKRLLSMNLYSKALCP